MQSREEIFRKGRIVFPLMLVFSVLIYFVDKFVGLAIGIGSLIGLVIVLIYYRTESENFMKYVYFFFGASFLLVGFGIIITESDIYYAIVQFALGIYFLVYAVKNKPSDR